MRKTLVLLVLATAAWAANQKIIGGPFVVNVTSRTATLVWIVESDTATLTPAKGGPAKTAPSLRAEKVTYTGLQPDTVYNYNVSNQDAGKGTFKTAPAANAATPFTFDVYGDTRTRHDVHRKVIDALVRHGIPDFIIHNGDLVENGTDNSLWPIFFDIERELLRHTAFFPALGNHERNARDFYDFFQNETPYFSFNWGNAHFAVLNSDIANAAPGKAAQQAYWDEQTKWLEDDLAKNQKADYRFVNAHHPSFSAVGRRQENNPHMRALVPLLEKYHVTAAFFGHDHNYQHYLKDGIHYVVSGGGGAPLYDVDKPPAGITVKVISTENFVSFSVNGKTVHVVAIDTDNKTLDEFDIHANPQP